MFVSFISAKDFFTIIDRKIVENYKLNLFDVTLDPFEWKLWLWMNKEMIQSKLMDDYYSYLAAANFNGYKFYNVWNTANGLAMLISLYFDDVFEESENWLLIDSIYAFYLLSFLFEARIKQFPYDTNEDNFQWFIDLYFDFYWVVIWQLKHKVSKKRFQEVRNKMLSHLEIFFMMFYYEKHVQDLLIRSCETGDNVNKQYCQWLFWSQPTAAQKLFIQSYENLSKSSKVSQIEQDIMFEVAPMDIQLKYLFLDTDAKEVVSCLIANVFDKKILDKKLTALMKDESELDFIIDYVTDPDNFKKWFFKWVKQYISHMRLKDWDGFDALDEMMSEIWDDFDKLDASQIPASIKKESKVMEQFLNFYISFMWWLSISRADSFFVRYYKSWLLSQLMNCFDINLKTESAVNLYWMRHVFFSKNQNYYQFVSKKIHQGKEKFFIPLTPIKWEQSKTTAYLLNAMDESALMVLLQDVNPQLGKLYVKNKALLDWFQAQYSRQISPMLKLSRLDFITQYYEPLFSHFALWENVISVLKVALEDQDIVRLKNSLYAFDVQLFHDLLDMLPWEKMQQFYNDTSMLNILAFFRETLFWFLIYYKYLQLFQEVDKKQNLNLSLLKKTYLIGLLNVNEALYPALSWVVNTILEQYGATIALFVELDDNKEFFSILKENWIDFLKKQSKKTEQEKEWMFSVEDLLWLRWMFKHITYYNKRYLIPN